MNSGNAEKFPLTPKQTSNLFLHIIIGKGRNDRDRELDRRRDNRDRDHRRDMDHRDRRSPRNDKRDERRGSGK